MNKMYGLWGIFIILASFFGFILGRLDFFGFFDGRHEINLLLLISTVLISYALGITIFLLDCSLEKKQTIPFAIGTLLFTVFFAFSNNNVFAVISATLLFFIFIITTFNEGKKRVKLFVRFVPKELFFPILKKGFLLLVMLFAVINFFETKTMAENNNIVSPSLIKTISKPFTVVFNKVLSDQIRGQLKDIPQSRVDRAARRQLIEFAVKETIRAMIQGKPFIERTIKPDDIPVNLLIIHNDGSIDIEPIVTEMAPLLAAVVNTAIGEHITLAPFIIAFFTLIIFQPLLLPLQFIEGYISLGIFAVLIKLRILTITKEMKEVDRVVF